jgi:hypothetical protein
MRITNTHGMPESIVRAITNDPYEGPKQRTDKISVSTLINPPKIHFLKIRHWDEIVEDASEHLWRLLGHSVHSVLERAEDTKTIKEERLEEEIDGITISGQMDLLGEDSIEDYKITSVWSYIFSPTGKPEWVAQLNLYRWLSRKIFNVKKLTIHCILRDHQGSKAKADANYPQIPFKSIPIAVWSLEDTDKYIRDRVGLFKSCIYKKDHELPECTAEEMWAKGDKYAVMKPGRKTAIKVCDTEAEAQAVIVAGYTIVKRPGSRNRCEDYCLVNKWCAQYKAYKGQIGAE